MRRRVIQREPGAVSAAFLALAVHLAFFAFLYLGISWQAAKPRPVMVDLWSALPEGQTRPAPRAAPPPRPAPKPQPKPEPPPRPAPKPEPRPEPAPPPPKPDIALKEKEARERKLAQEKRQQEEKRKADEKRQAQEAERRAAEERRLEMAKLEEQQREAARVQQELEAAARRLAEEQAAAQAKLVADYTDRIRTKIRRLIVMPPDITGNEQAEFDVVLLPGGEVLGVKLARRSGNEAYDQAVERAIYKAQPLPLPPDPALFKQFRELHLRFKSKDEG